MSARISNPVMQFLDENGHPFNGGFLCTYSAGTNTPAVTYSDMALSVPNPVRIPLNDMGIPQTDVWVRDNAAYKFVIESSAGVAIWTRDYVFVPSGGAEPIPTGDKLWGHWENKDTWKNIGQYTTSVEMAQYMTRSEGELGQTGRPFLVEGVYDYKLELAFNIWDVTDALEFRTYMLNIKYGDDTLREMAFNFRADTTENYMLTEWAGGVFKMPSEGNIDINVWKKGGGNENHRLKVSHLFIHRID